MHLKRLLICCHWSISHQNVLVSTNVNKTIICMLDIRPEKCAADFKVTFKDDETFLQIHVCTRSKLKTELIQMQFARHKCISRVFLLLLNSRGGKLSVFVCPGVGIWTSCKKHSRGVPCGVGGELEEAGGGLTAGIEPRNILFSDEQFSRHVLP